MAKSNILIARGSWIYQLPLIISIFSNYNNTQQAISPTSGGPRTPPTGSASGSESEERSETPSGAAAPSYGLTLRRQSRRHHRSWAGCTATPPKSGPVRPEKPEKHGPPARTAVWAGDFFSAVHAPGAMGAEGGLLRHPRPAVGTGFHFHHSASIRCSTVLYRLAGLTWVHRWITRPMRPFASFREGCSPVSITFISTPRE